MILFSWLGISAVNPLLLFGALAVAAPIIIHLLARRRFRVVQWAAMQFLLEAEHRNRKRIRLEQLLLLLLRCLAVLLVAFLLSRLFMTPRGLAAMLSPGAVTERIVLLDDSPSMMQRIGPRTVFDAARQSLIAFVRRTAQSHAGDSLTLVLTSRPDRPVLNGQYFHQSESMIRTIDGLHCSDVPAAMDQALAGVLAHLDEEQKAGAGQVNRVMYVMTDLRRRDWTPAPGSPAPGSSETTGNDGGRGRFIAPADRSLGKLLERLDVRLNGAMIVDMEAEAAGNLTVSSVESADKAVVAGVPTQLQVEVTNYAATAARDVAATLQVGDSPPMSATITEIGPGQTGTARFAYTFTDQAGVGVTATIGPDALPADDRRYFAAQVTAGVKVLLVDGDPSTEYGRSETFYLHRALAPPGSTASGNVVDEATDSQFAGLDLSSYQVIWLANVYQMPDGQRDALEQWVKAGGGLVIAPGDQVDATLYNQLLWREGAGLLPMALGEVAGDPNQRHYVNPVIVTPNHPVMGAFEGTNNPAINLVKFYRWWSPGSLKDVTVAAALSDADHSPLLVEKGFGSGRVAMLSSAVDDDWNNWARTNGATFVVTMLELNRRVAKGVTDRGNIAVGGTLVWPVDLSRYRPEGTMVGPDSDEATTLQAIAQGTPAGGLKPDGLTPGGLKGDELVFAYDQTRRAGFYRLTVGRHDGGPAMMLFAANIDPTEGDLARMDQPSLARQLENTKVKIVTAAQYSDQGEEGGKSELWRPLAMILLVVLAAEQSLAWWFGRPH
ncbi:MAG: BatA domain-containing protein [Phycisphaerales bacterium]